MAGAIEPARAGIHYGQPHAWRRPEPVSQARAELSRARALATLPASPAAAAPSRWLRLRPPTIARLLSVAALALHALLFGLDAPLGRSPAAGALLMSLGFVWMAWARLTFRRAGAPLTSTAQPARLVDEGPYRFGRNPMVLAIVVMMLGMGVASGVPFMAIAALNFIVIVAAVHIPHEEAQLQGRFGGWYSDYAASVRRWL